MYKRQEYQTVYEKYRNVKIDGIEYHGKGRAVSEALVSESIGNYTFVGYDEINDGKKYTAEFEVYKLQNIAQSQFVAVKMEDSYYVFKSSEYSPPSTLGELMETVNLSKVVELSRFSEKEDNPNSNHFVLNNDDYIWEVLTDCKSAVFVEDESWMVGDRDYLSFTITSDSLGAYKAALYVTEDGYLWTNAFDWQYLFNIGEEAAGKIIKYAKEKSIETEYEAYRNSVAGTIVEITEEYILVDDSILCKNPADGITYKVLLNDLRISRYVDYGIVKVGDTVHVISMDSEGTITALADSKGKLKVQMGIISASLPPTDLLLVEHEKKKPQKATVTGGKSMNRMMNIKPEINVLGMTVDEATSLVDRFLDDALMAHLHRVTIIHGKGTGALRKGIHQFLKSQPHVKSFRLGEFGEGDAGVTIVEL